MKELKTEVEISKLRCILKLIEDYIGHISELKDVPFQRRFVCYLENDAGEHELLEIGFTEVEAVKLFLQSVLNCKPISPIVENIMFTCFYIPDDSPELVILTKGILEIFENTAKNMKGVPIENAKVRVIINIGRMLDECNYAVIHKNKRKNGNFTSIRTGIYYNDYDFKRYFADKSVKTEN